METVIELYKVLYAKMLEGTLTPSEKDKLINLNTNLKMSGWLKPKDRRYTLRFK